MARQTIKAFIESLRCDNVESETRRVDWTEALGENCDGWRSYETRTCDECGKEVSSNGLCGEFSHAELDDSTECKNVLNFDGPMMNYFYPCDFSGIGGVEEAGRRAQGCCVAIEFENGDTGFALAGGGMDLTWDIAGSYVACGQLPPVDKTRLPEFAGMQLTANRRRIVAACIESNRVASNWAQRNIAEIKRVAKALRANNTPKRKKAA